jgi:2,5-diketo-D-gluconate reductase B
MSQLSIDAQGAHMPALGFGTWRLSGKACRRSVADALEVGYRHIDTARMYGNERQVGQGIVDTGVPRDEVFVVTKLWNDELRPEEVAKAVPDSLERLGLEVIDLLLIHWPNPRVPLADTLGAMAGERAAGRLRHLGVSNFDAGLMEEAVGLAPILTNQVPYSPYDRVADLLEAAGRHQIVITAYTPIARGRVDREPALIEIGRRHGKTPAQVTLRWLVQQPLVAAIPKAASPEHRRANFDIFDFELTAEEMAAIAGLSGR